MAFYIGRSASNRLVTAQDDDETGEPSTEMLRLIDKGFTLYRVSSGGNGTFVLTPQRIVANSAVTEPRTVSASLEDDV